MGFWLFETQPHGLEFKLFGLIDTYMIVLQSEAKSLVTNTDKRDIIVLQHQQQQKAAQFAVNKANTT